MVAPSLRKKSKSCFPNGSERVGRSLLAKAAQLVELPLSGRVVPEERKDHVRELIEGNYRIIYELDAAAKVASVLRIWHGARGKPDL